MGDYTSVNIFRSATGFNAREAPSGTINLCIRWGEADLKKYLRVTPASDSASMADTNMWVEEAATSFAAYHFNKRLANQYSPEQTYQGTMRQDRGSRFKGRAWSSEMWWDAATKICDLHGRDIIIKRIDE